MSTPTCKHTSSAAKLLVLHMSGDSGVSIYLYYVRYDTLAVLPYRIFLLDIFEEHKGTFFHSIFYRSSTLIFSFKNASTVFFYKSGSKPKIECREQFHPRILLLLVFCSKNSRDQELHNRYNHSHSICVVVSSGSVTLKVPVLSHQIRLAWKWYGWIDLDE